VGCGAQSSGVSLGPHWTKRTVTLFPGRMGTYMVPSGGRLHLEHHASQSEVL
jgi:hypothetical protein